MRKEFIQMRRDRHTLAMLLGIPVFQLLLFGFAIRQEVRNLPTVVYDESATQQSRALVQQFTGTGNFRLRGQVGSYEAAQRSVDAGHARAAIVIPRDYAHDLKRGRSTPIQVLVDASDPTAAQAAIGAAQLVGQRASLQILRERSAGGSLLATTPIEVRVRPLYNPALASALFIVPGIIGMILSNILIMMTALSMVREREHGTMEQLIVTPLQRAEIMIGKIAPYVLVGVVQITAILGLGHLLFHVPIRGSILLVYGASLIFIVASLGLGLFISTLSQTQAQAMQSSFFFLLPNVLLSGFMFPREAMPPLANWLGNLLPLTHFLWVIRGVVLKGVGLAELWPQLLALVGFAVMFFSFATVRFQKKLG
ncbi:MAG: ABC transporter permease [Candidatus Eisenbacteria bacterium]|uniref:Transport permease protein n=1 Tax=Eiseniibacteriota bacterium TaxID=2212470 RepID=A0A849SGX5_UNCEI|nr:ABC transporter permease [Candidatus Eisenbacteria bacterium]